MSDKTSFKPGAAIGTGTVKFKICHIISSLYVGGAEMTLYRMLARLDREQLPSVVVSLVEVGPIGDRIRELGIPVHSLGMQRGQPSPVGLLRLVKLLRYERPRILQTWLYHADLLGLVAGTLTRIPAIIWNLRASNMDMSQYRRLSGLTVKACAGLSRFPRAVVVNSEAGRTFHERIGYRPRQWIHIPNGIDLEEFRPDPAAYLLVRRELGLQPGAPLIGLVARFDPMKDHATFLRAAGLYAQIDPRAHFVLAGDGVTAENEMLCAWIHSEHLDGRIHLLGRRTDIPRLTAALDVATSSSLSEGSSNAIGEAMACGVPCVVTDAGDSARLVGDTGVVVPVKHPPALAAGWQKLIDMGVDSRRQLGEAARERIRQNNSLDQAVRQYQELYLSLS